MQFDRASGVLLHVTSLPSRYGIGDLGKEAYNFVDFLKNANQKLWQVLPLNPCGNGGSPYNCFSAFAGNTLLISIDKLIQIGLLKAEEVADIPSFTETKVEFPKIIKFKNQLFLKAFNRFNELNEGDRYTQFKEQNSYWLSDLCLYMAVKEHFHNRAWNFWDTDITFRQKPAIERYQNKLADKIRYQEFLQYIFSKQWRELKNYANQKDIKIIGDLPIFVAHDSSDVWVYPELFDLDHKGNPRKVSGVPPDYFSKTGQLWGNPHYNWKRMQEDDFLWWRRRLEKLFEQVDIARIDHFRGFEAYWEVDASEKTAVKGKWIKAPGDNLFSTLKKFLGDLPIIVEDLGFITPEVNKMKKKFGFPGMKIFQFSFDETNTKSRPDDYEKHCVAYTGTHDNDTLLSWYKELKKSRNSRVLEILENYYGINNCMTEEEICWTLIEVVYKTNANFVIVPLQDILCLDNKARMNLPGTIGGNNWLWRYKKGDITKEMEKKINILSQKHHR